MGTMHSEHDRLRLLETFKDMPADQHAKGWDSLWREKVTPWDRNEPSPALVDTLDERQDILGSSIKEGGVRKRALVPGCGKGMTPARRTMIRSNAC
jgi:methyl halide transferase